MTPANPIPATGLLTCVSFHYVESRLQYLRQTLATQPQLADRVRVLVITNTDTPEEQDAIRACFPPTTDQFSCEIYPAGVLDHPFDLTWVHKKILTEVFLPDPTLSHFLYLEDDLELKPEVMAYWLTAREQLRPFGLIPSFFRVERAPGSNGWCSTDQFVRACALLLPHVEISPALWFVNLPNPYQGMYLFDRELAVEHVAGPAIRKGFGPWKVRESAAQGQTFVEVPRGFIARNAIPFDPRNNSIPEHCFVHHLPNNYAENPETVFGKLAVPDGLLAPPRLTLRTVIEGVIGPPNMAETVGWGRVWELERAVGRQVWHHLSGHRTAESGSFLG
ncbi:MAG: hypothetical protein NT146_16440 [Mycobacterium sp.]|nr:hypothetical protein [Mycobacterium sp.]